MINRDMLWASLVEDARSLPDLPLACRDRSTAAAIRNLLHLAIVEGVWGASQVAQDAAVPLRAADDDKKRAAADYIRKAIELFRPPATAGAYANLILRRDNAPCVSPTIPPIQKWVPCS